MPEFRSPPSLVSHWPLGVLSRDLSAPGAHPRSLPLPPLLLPLPLRCLAPPPSHSSLPPPPRGVSHRRCPLPCRPASQLPSSTCFRRRQKDSLLARPSRTELPPLNLFFCFNLTLDNLSHQDGECPRRPFWRCCIPERGSGPLPGGSFVSFAAQGVFSSSAAPASRIRRKAKAGNQDVLWGFSGNKMTGDLRAKGAGRWKAMAGG